MGPDREHIVIYSVKDSENSKMSADWEKQQNSGHLQTLTTRKVFTKAWWIEPPRTTDNPRQQNDNHSEAQASSKVEGPLSFTNCQ